MESWKIYSLLCMIFFTSSRSVSASEKFTISDIINYDPALERGTIMDIPCHYPTNYPDINKCNLYRVPVPSRKIKTMKSRSIQTTSIDLQSDELDYPVLLKIKTILSSLKNDVSIKINEKVVQQLKEDLDTIDLAPYLVPGNNTVKILIEDKPLSMGSITVQLKSLNNSVTQQSSVIGGISQIIEINVQE